MCGLGDLPYGKSSMNSLMWAERLPIGPSEAGVIASLRFGSEAGDQFIGPNAVRGVVEHRGDHHLVHLDSTLELNHLRTNGRRTPDDRVRVAGVDRVALCGGVLVRSGLLGAREQTRAALTEADKGQPAGSG